MTHMKQLFEPFSWHTKLFGVQEQVVFDFEKRDKAAIAFVPCDFSRISVVHGVLIRNKSRAGLVSVRKSWWYI